MKKEKTISVLYGREGYIEKLEPRPYEFMGDKKHRTVCLHLGQGRTAEINIYALERLVKEALEDFEEEEHEREV